MKQNDNKAFIRWGATIFSVIALAVVLVLILTNLSGFFAAVKAIVRVLSPLIFGAVFAFLLNPIVHACDKRIAPLLMKKAKSESNARKASRVIAIVAAFVTFALFIYAFFAMMLPQIEESIRRIVQYAPHYYTSSVNWLNKMLDDNPQIAQHLATLLSELQTFLKNWVNTTLPSDMQIVISTVTSSVVAAVKAVVNVLIGLFASVYILWRKDILQAQFKKLILAVFAPKSADRILYLARQTNQILNGFFIGKLIDSLIIGIICYIGMLIFRLPYPELISTILGVTNIVPFFGPFIGAVPSTLLILLVNPLQAFYFVIFILVLQQIDGNIIGPKILGNSVGISGLWVLVSITIATSLFGFAGMLLGVPVFALFYQILSDWVNSTLKAKKLMIDTQKYCAIESVAEASADEPPQTPE